MDRLLLSAPKDIGLLAKTLATIGILMMASVLVLTFHNIYNYIWRKKLYAVNTMAFLYLCIPFTVIARVLNFGYLCR
jgi:hypothetical protein